MDTLIIFVLITILAISQTNAVCCNDPAYKVFHKCYDLPDENSSPYKDMLSNWYARREPDWEDPQLTNAICYTMFCANGYVRGVCGTGCTLFGCFCDSCYSNDGTSYEDMEKAWAKENGFTMLCSAMNQECVNI